MEPEPPKKKRREILQPAADHEAAQALEDHVEAVLVRSYFEVDHRRILSTVPPASRTAAATLSACSGRRYQNWNP
jgi:hypothetical protein